MKQNLFEKRDSLGQKNILEYFFDLGIRGPDFIWAALGPALEAYSAHPYVKKTDGGMMTVQDFLKEVRKLVLQFSLGELPGFKDLQQQTHGRGDAIEIDAVTQYYLLHRAFFSLTPAPAGACILYANACGKTDRELQLVWNVIEQGGKGKKLSAVSRQRSVMGAEVAADEDVDDGNSESKGNEYRLVDWGERARKDGLGENRSGQSAALIDRLHRLMFLFQQNRAGEVQQAYEIWGLASEPAFPRLLQAVRELAVRDGQDTERRLVEALASQLKLNRRAVAKEQEVEYVSLFD